MRDCVLQGWPEQDIPREEFQPFIWRKRELSVEDGCVLWGNRVVISQKVRDDVLRMLHVAHPGITRMKRLARSYVW